MDRDQDVLIVGAGHAGAQTAIALRQRGFAGTIGLIGDDANPPYERPPLSKDYLSGTRPFDRLLFRPQAFWSDQRIRLMSGRKALGVDPAAKSVRCDDGRSIGYGKLVWAAGGRARRLDCAGHDLAGVHSVRTRGDVDTLLTELPNTDRVVVIGGGFIGMEAAAVLCKSGKAVTLLEGQDRVLARVCGREIAAFYEAEHRAHGVDIRTGVTAASLAGDSAGRVAGVELHGGERIACDIVIVGIGIVCAIEPLRAAGAACDASVLVDQVGRTTLPDVYAIGDCASRPCRFAKIDRLRIESVQNANAMAQAVAADITRADPDAEPIPWFWSHQYDLKLQTAGINIGYDRTLTWGEPAKRSFAVAYMDGGRLLAVDCVNAPRQFAQAKKLIGDQSDIDLTQFGYSSSPVAIPSK